MTIFCILLCILLIFFLFRCRSAGKVPLWDKKAYRVLYEAFIRKRLKSCTSAPRYFLAYFLAKNKDEKTLIKI